MALTYLTQRNIDLTETFDGALLPLWQDLSI